MSDESKTNREYPNNFLKLFHQRIKEAQEELVLAEKIAANVEAMRSRIFMDYGDQYADWSLENWKYYYSLALHRATRLKDFFQKFGDNLVGEYINDAQECFWQIQQRKLFNMQCLFRAGKIKIPEIGSVHEFNFWEQHIAHCPFLAPVTKDEVELYKKYLQSDYCSIVGLAFLHGWQDYDTYHREYDDGSNYDDDDEDPEGVMPPWYVFYDMHMGTTELLTYPDLRGEAESQYRSLAREHNGYNARINEIIANEGPMPRQLPPLAGYSEEWLMHFADTYDTPENRQLLINKFNVEGEFGENFEYVKDEVEKAYDMVLSVAKEVWPVEWNEDWRQGLIKAAHKYKVKKIAEAMDYVFEEYEMRMDLGLTTEDAEPQLEAGYDTTRQEILLGRKLSGEPEDFDF